MNTTAWERLRERWLLLLDRIPQRLRWRIADALNRVPWLCWAELATWALYGPSDKDRALPMPWPADTGLCRADAARIGRCWCGKLRDPEGERRWDEEVARRDERAVTCACGHDSSDHDAGECWATVVNGQCPCNWWEPTS